MSMALTITRLRNCVKHIRIIAAYKLLALVMIVTPYNDPAGRVIMRQLLSLAAEIRKVEKDPHT